MTKQHEKSRSVTGAPGFRWHAGLVLVSNLYFLNHKIRQRDLACRQFAGDGSGESSKKRGSHGKDKENRLWILCRVQEGTKGGGGEGHQVGYYGIFKSHKPPTEEEELLVSGILTAAVA